MTQPFPTKEHPQACVKGCGVQIYLSKKTGKYLPYEVDDTLHDCQNKSKQDAPTYTLDAVQKKLESIGIIVNIERLMKQ